MFSSEYVTYNRLRKVNAARPIFHDYMLTYSFRYWSHTVSCSSCNLAYKGLNALEIVLQVFSLASIGIVAAAKQGALSAAARSTLVSVAIISFLVSKWLSHFVYKNFHFHDYDHASRWDTCVSYLTRVLDERDDRKNIYQCLCTCIAWKHLDT